MRLGFSDLSLPEASALSGLVVPPKSMDQYRFLAQKAPQEYRFRRPAF